MLKNGTIHQVTGGARCFLRDDGSGFDRYRIIAGGPMRAIFEVMGVTDIVQSPSRGSTTLQHGSRHPWIALNKGYHAAEIAAKRGKESVALQLIGGASHACNQTVQSARLRYQLHRGRLRPEQQR